MNISPVLQTGALETLLVWPLGPLGPRVSFLDLIWEQQNQKAVFTVP